MDTEFATVLQATPPDKPDVDITKRLRNELDASISEVENLSDKATIEKQLAEDAFRLGQISEQLTIEGGDEFLLIAGKKLNRWRVVEAQFTQKSHEIERRRRELERLDREAAMQRNLTPVPVKTVEGPQNQPSRFMSLFIQLLGTSTVGAILIGFIKPFSDQWSKFLGSRFSAGASIRPEEPRIRVILEQLLRSVDASSTGTKTDEPVPPIGVG